ncbi:hypothetical protein Sste5346_004737 [Sporothrix stenoceras]|uniref:Uncharacterized protein n=1 Tax=Sporothrix stenoceras TaxID=5173 RepID=A0ABR3Z841_9PEZI
MDIKALAALRGLHDRGRTMIRKGAKSRAVDSDTDNDVASNDAEQKLSRAPSLTAFHSRLWMPIGDEEGAFAPRAVAPHAAVPRASSPRTVRFAVSKDAAIETEPVTETKIAGKQAAAEKDEDKVNECAIACTANNDVEKPQDAGQPIDTCAVGNSDAEDDDIDESERRAAFILKAVAKRRAQLRMDEYKKSAAATAGSPTLDANGHLIINGGAVKPARNADGSLISELTMQLRRQDDEVAAAAKALGMIVADDASSSRHSDQSVPPAPHNSPTTSTEHGAGEHPNPLRSNPSGPITPPHTPPFQGAESPQLPPAPPSTPASSNALQLIPRRRLGDVMTPPLSPPTTIPSIVSAVATIISTTSTASSPAMASSSHAGSFSDTASSSLVETFPPITTIDGTLIRGPAFKIPQDAINAAGLSTTGEMSTYAKHSLAWLPHCERPARSFLLGAEVNKALYRHIMQENSLHTRVNYFGPARNESNDALKTTPSITPSAASLACQALRTIKDTDDIDVVTALAPPPFHRKYRPAPRMQKPFYVPKVNTKPIDYNGFRVQPAVPEIDLEAELYRNECYDFANGYNSKGW